jgi:hypothetical protein
MTSHGAFFESHVASERLTRWPRWAAKNIRLLAMNGIFFACLTGRYDAETRVRGLAIIDGAGEDGSVLSVARGFFS